MATEVHSSAGEKLLDHLRCWLNPESLNLADKCWENNQNCETAASILELFHLLPAQAVTLLESSTVNTVSLSPPIIMVPFCLSCKSLAKWAIVAVTHAIVISPELTTRISKASVHHIISMQYTGSCIKTFWKESCSSVLGVLSPLLEILITQFTPFQPIEGLPIEILKAIRSMLWLCTSCTSGCILRLPSVHRTLHSSTSSILLCLLTC